ncbi:MAG: thiamine diphosphokinase [Fimbriimonadaceae bacterium]|nr:thiamine diphosphokinase [Chthonomonadaceae bacterium]MCO5296691.1 thiamine diphosphokinase [Fimbriimonadaceae bacterium]
MATRVLGVLAGEDQDVGDLVRWARSAEVVLAADSAADRLLEGGITPHRIVGDMDSASPAALASGAELIRDDDVHRSDCDKLLDHAWRSGWKQITLAGIEGDRLDHLLAALLSAARSPLEIRLALRDGTGLLVREGGESVVGARVGQLVSLLPIGGPCRATLTGVRWPVSDAEFGPTGTWSLSNEAVEECVSAHVHLGCALLVLGGPPDEALPWP